MAISVSARNYGASYCCRYHKVIRRRGQYLLELFVIILPSAFARNITPDLADRMWLAVGESYGWPISGGKRITERRDCPSKEVTTFNKSWYFLMIVYIHLVK